MEMENVSLAPSSREAMAPTTTCRLHRQELGSLRTKILDPAGLLCADTGGPPLEEQVRESDAPFGTTQG